MKMNFNFAAPPHRRTAAQIACNIFVLMATVILTANTGLAQRLSDLPALPKADHIANKRSVEHKVSFFPETQENSDDPEEQAACTSPVSVELGLQIDKSLVDAFDGDVDMARSFASSAFSTARSIWFDIGLTQMDYTILVNPIWFPMPYLDSNQDLFYPKEDTWARRIIGDWSANRPCIKKDGIVYVTGRPNLPSQPTARGYNLNSEDWLCKQYDQNRGRRAAIVCLQRNANGDPDAYLTGRTMAHEIGHQFGLDHEDDFDGCNTPCLPQLPQNEYLMCSSSSGETLSSCMIGVLNTNFRNLVGNPRCLCLAEVFPTPAEESCEICNSAPVSLETDNLNPAKGCGTSREEINFVSVIKGGCIPKSDAIIRFRYHPSLFKAKKDITGKVVGNYFTHEENVLSSGGAVIWKELVARNTDGSEKKIDLSLGDEITIDFAIEYDPQPNLPELPLVNVQIYVDQPDEPTSSIILGTRPFFPIEVQPGQTIHDILPKHIANRLFLIKGDLIIPELDVSIPLNNYVTNRPDYLLKGYQLIMDSGKKVVLESGARVRLVESSVTGCAQMWEGFTLQGNSLLSMSNSIIEDAQIAVNANNSTLRAQGSEFRNNNLSVRTAPGGANVTLLGNRYATTGTGLKPAYSGQSPAPLGKGFAGLYLTDAGSISLAADPISGKTNTFSNLKYGIIAKNTQLNVRNALFEDITQVPKGDGYETFIGGPAGKAIYTEKGLTWVNNEDGQPITFRNCHTGVETFGATAYVWNTVMTDMTNGIITTNGNYAVHSLNTIEAVDRGIELRYAAPLGVPSPNYPAMEIGGVYANTIMLSGNPNGVGINTAGSKLIGVDPSGGTTGPPQFTGGNIAGNNITVQEGANAIQVNTARKLSVWNNTIALENTQGQSRGIALNGGDQNTATCNTIAGSTGGHTGLFALHADRAKLYCNRSAGSGTGLRVEGMLVGKAKADIAGNTLNNNITGMLYGTDAISGTQLHRGNLWTGSGTVAVHQGIVAVANQSQYVVDATEDPEFLPNSSMPQNWFLDVSEQEPSFTCPTPTSACIWIEGLTALSSELHFEQTIAQGTLPGSVFTTTINWLAQRRLHERIQEEGNPYPGDTIIANFLTAAQINGIADYAAMQVGIRAAMAVGQNDQETLQGYEAALIQGLDTLAVLDSILNARHLSQQDSAELTAQRLDLLDSMQAYASAKYLLTTHLDSLRSVTAGVLLAQNNNLSDLEEPAAVHEKTVNGIFLRTVLRNNFTFSTQDSTTLESIAALCPLSDGEAVLWARSLLTLMTEAPRAYPDDTTCAVQERSRPAANTAGKGIRIYPNPAMDWLVVEYEPLQGIAQTFQLFNALGQLIQAVALPVDGNQARIELTKTHSGIYWYQISNAATGCTSGKVIINH